MEVPFVPPDGNESSDYDVPLEVAAVGAKMRNLARVAGERASGVRRRACVWGSECVADV